MSGNVKFYVCADSGKAFSFDGSDWTALSTGTVLNLYDVHGVAEDDVWFVGGTTGDPQLRHYNGSTFTNYASPVAQEIHGVYAVAHDEVYAVTNQRAVLKFNGQSWAVEFTYATANIGPELWHDGSLLYFPRKGLSFKFLGTWNGSAIDWDTTEGIIINGLHGSSASTVYAVDWGVVAASGTFVMKGSIDDWAVDDAAIQDNQASGNRCLWVNSETGEVYYTFYKFGGGGTNGVRMRSKSGGWSTILSVGGDRQYGTIRGVYGEILAPGDDGYYIYGSGSSLVEYRQSDTAADMNSCVGFQITDAVKTDLETAHGTHRMLLAKIDGLDAYLWQRSSKDTPSWVDRTNNWVCLRPGINRTTNMDLTEHWTDFDHMTIELDEIKDTDGTSIFGKRFSTARWDVEDHWRVSYADEDASARVMIAANSTTIPLKSVTGVAASGDYYLGLETLGFTGSDADGLTGVTKGKYPCVGTGNWGYTYRRPREIDPWMPPAVGEVPFSFAGRRIALYVITWDDQTKDWQLEGREKLLWIGRLSDNIQFDPKEQKWVLSCQSILKDFERKLFDSPTTHLDRINLMGDHGRSFTLLEWDMDSNDHGGSATITVGKNIYTTKTLVNEIQDKLTNASWTLLSDSGVVPHCTYHITYSEGSGKITIEARFRHKYALGGLFKKVKLVFSPNNHPCHALLALGFAEPQQNPEIRIAHSSGYGPDLKDEVVVFENEPAGVCEAYHPLDYVYNGNRLIVSDTDGFWADQGDNSSPIAWVQISDGLKINEWGSMTLFHAKFDSIGPTGFITIGNPPGSFFPGDHIRGVFGKEKVEVKQIYNPTFRTIENEDRGPFESTLYPMLSTGTDYYNHATYDVCPLEGAGGVDSNIVDISSFLKADYEIRNDPTAMRANMISDYSGLSLKELITRECKLYGYALCWDDEKFVLKRIVPPPIDTWTATIDEGARAISNEKPLWGQSSDTVVNQYELKLRWNISDGKFLAPIIITDVDSSKAFFDVKRMTIEHSGLPLTSKTDQEITALMKSVLLDRYYRFPSPIVDVTLAPHYHTKFYAGDVVKVTGSTWPDPLGSGTFSTTSYALVLRKGWNYLSWTGTATLMILSRYQNYGMPWAPAALVDRSYSTAPYSGGFDSTNYRLKLKSVYFGIAGDEDDGAAFGDGYFVNIIERNPSDPSNPQKWVDQEVSDPYETDGSEVLSLTADLSGWDAAKEYIVTFCGYSSATTGQKSYGVWLADDLTEKVGSVYAYRYG